LDGDRWNTQRIILLEHHVLGKIFFCNLGCNVKVSDDTNKEILDWGVKHCSNETCLPVKVFSRTCIQLKRQSGLYIHTQVYKR